MARTLPSAIGGVTVEDIVLAPSGGDVSTFQGAWDWIYSNFPNLVSANRIVRVRVSGMNTVSANPSLAGAVTGDSTHYVIFAADEGEGLCDQAPSTPLRFDASYAGLQSTSGTSVHAFSVPASVSSPIHLEALQFRYNSVGDGNAAVLHSAIDAVTRSCVFFHDQSGVGGSCLRFERSLRSYNDICIHPYSGYVNGIAAIAATTAAHISQIHNATMWSSGPNMTLGFEWDNTAASGSKCHNLLKLGGTSAEGIQSVWDRKGIATTGGATSGTGGYTNLVVADTIESGSSPIDLRIKSTATSVRNGGYDNTSDNPLDFFFRVRKSGGGNFNIGAFDLSLLPIRRRRRRG